MLPAAKRSKPASVAWPAMELTGPGGFDGEEKLKSLAGDPALLTGIFVATMGLNGRWLLSALGLPEETSMPIVIACHHRERCWSGKAAERRVEAGIPGHSGCTLIFPPFADAPGKENEYAAHHAEQAPRGLLGCVHAKMLIFYRRDRLRVVVSTANMTRGQWVHTRNHLWWCDFPASSSADASTSSVAAALVNGGGFASELAAYMSAMLAPCVPSAVDASFVTALGNYDFSSAAEQGVHLVASVPGIVRLRLPTLPTGASLAFRCALAGADHHRPRSNAVAIESIHKALAAGPHGSSGLDADDCCTLDVLPLPNNPHDANCLAVCLPRHARHLLGPRQYRGQQQPLPDGLVGFLPKPVASWLAPLLRLLGLRIGVRAKPRDVFSSAAHLGREMLVVDVYVPQSPAPSSPVTTTTSSNNTAMSEDEVGRALVQLLAKAERPRGLARLRQLLLPHAWPARHDEQKAFHYTSSSVGNVFTPDGRRFLHSFAKAVGCATGAAADSADDDPAHCFEGGAGREGSGRMLLPQICYPSVAELDQVLTSLYEAAAYKDAASGEVRIGGRVRLCGLERKPELNGRRGTILEAPSSGKPIAPGRCAVRLDRARLDEPREVSISLKNLCQGPPALSWPYMMSDKTWDEACKAVQQQSARGGSGNAGGPTNVSVHVSDVLRVCQIKRMRLCDTTREVVEDDEHGATAMMHSKICMRHFKDGSGWVYLGSHNCSPAAWGKPLASDSAEADLAGVSEQLLWTANWELGVIRIAPPRIAPPRIAPPAQQTHSGGGRRYFWHLLGGGTAVAVVAPPSELPPGQPLREVVVGVDPAVEWPAGYEPAAGTGGGDRASPALTYLECEEGRDATTAHMRQWLLMRHDEAKRADTKYALALVEPFG